MDSLQKRPRVMVIGLDGATFDLIRPWAQQGKLPTFAKIMEEGCWGELTSTIPPFTAPAWCSFATGKNPGKHGMYDFAGRKHGTYEMVPLDATYIKAPPIWEILSHYGRSVGVLNVPMTYPPAKVNGFLVTGMLTPPRASIFTYPPELGPELMKAVPGYAIWPEGVFHPLGQEASFLKVVLELTEMRYSATRYLMGRLDWDFFMVVFRGPDLVQHWLWKHMEAQQNNEGLADGILEVYKKLDRILASFLELIPPNTFLMLMSDHGAGPLDTYIHVNTWLLEQGYLKIKPYLLPQGKLWMFRLGVTPRSVYRLLMRTGLRKGIGSMVRERKGQVRRLLDQVFLSFKDVDWPRTLAYSYGNVGPIYLNVKGREPLGRVSPGPEYERLREEIALRLMELRDPDSGLPLVEKVYRKEELYSGPALGDAPDLFFMPKDLRHQAFGLLQFTSNKWWEPSFDRSGGHRMNGIVLFWGPGVRRGILSQAKMTDLAPTVLALLGIPIPVDMDGRVLQEAFLEELWRENRITYSDAWKSGGIQGEGLTTDETDEIQRRLKGLGYV